MQEMQQHRGSANLWGLQENEHLDFFTIGLQATFSDVNKRFVHLHVGYLQDNP